MTGMIKKEVYRFYNEQEDFLLASEYPTRSELRVKNFNLYARMWKKDRLKDIKHHAGAGNRYKRLVYVLFSKSLNKAYIGLTYNFDVRLYKHKMLTQHSTVAIIMSSDFEYTLLTDYIDAGQAAELEEKYVQSYKDLGFTVTNVNRAGNLGGSQQIHSESSVYAAALLCKNKSEFKKNTSVYAAALKLGILNRLQEDFGWIVGIKWNKQKSFDLAREFSSFSLFAKKYSGSISHSVRNGYYEELKNNCNNRINQND